MKIKVFWNVNELANWELVFDQQFDLLVSSGLMAAATEVIVMGNGRIKSFIPKIDANPQYQQLCFTSVCDSAALWEYPSLAFMHDYAINSPEPFLACYFHLKGLTRWGDPNVDDWRDFLNWATIENWQQNVAALQTHDTSGPNWEQTPWPHYSGNFWWANSDYISKLTPLVHPHKLMTLGVTQFKNQSHWRFDHEAWIGSGQPRAFEIAKSFSEGGQHYHKRYPRELYRQF